MEKLMIRNVLGKFGFVRPALVVAVGIPFMTALSAYGQDPVASPAQRTQASQGPLSSGPIGGASPAPAVANQGGATAEAERVIVTGSNIPTAEEVGPNPVLNINRDLINKSGERNAEELLRNLPVANANGVPISNNATGFTPGAASISLRGFDPSATLVLIDGKRVAPYPVGTGGTFSFIDLLTIPKAAIESIEVLKDGASTTYGADAVAGVVNIKLFHEYRGAEATVGYGNTLDKDAGEFHADLLFGIGDDKTQVTGVINFYHHNSVFNRDRGFSAAPPFFSTNSSPENFQLADAVVIAAGGIPATAGPLTFGHAPFFTNGLAPASDYIYTGARSSLFNFNQFSGSYPESERYGGYTSFTHKVCEDQLVIYGDAFYQNVKTHNELAPGATGSFQTNGQVTLAIPPRTPIAPGAEPPDTPTHLETGVPADAFNPFNPFQQIISGGSRARLAEFGNRLFDNESDAFLATLGLRGDKLFDGTWGYDLGYRYSQIKNTSTGTLVSTSRYNRILNAADPIFDPGSDAFIGTTVPYNPFGDYRVPIASNSGALEFATVHPKDIDTSKLWTLDLNIYTTALFKLPGGPVGFAFGGQFRRENIEQDPDTLNVEGDIIGSSRTAITHAGRKDFAFYAEASIPAISPEMGVPVFHSLEFTAAARYEEFRNNDTNVLVPKFGMRWQPFDDTLTIRATWGEGFREPSLFELFSSPTSGLLPTTFNGVSEPETTTITSSNPDLEPEDSRALSAGVVYTPKWVPGLTMSVDIWGIERRGVVTAPTAQEVVNRFISGSLLPGEAVFLDPSGTSVNAIFDRFQNAGRQNARGIDLGLQYQYQSPFGTFTSYTQATYLDSFILQTTPQGKGREVSGYTVGGIGGDGYLKWRGVSRLDWAWNGFDVIGTLHYLDGYREQILSSADLGGPPSPGKFHYVKHTWIFDLQGSYELTFVAPVESQPVAGYSKDGKEMVRGKDGKAIETGQTANYSMPCWKNLLNNTKITVGCNNVFGQDPPDEIGFEFGNANGYPGFIYDAVGRFVYVELTKKF
jgi:iron complex outermembrane recepter protein